MSGIRSHGNVTIRRADGGERHRLNLEMDMVRLLLSFRGRIPRSTFWITALLLSLAFIILLIAIEKILGRSSSLVLYPPLFWAFGAIVTKRLRDRGKSPLWLLLALIPVFGPLWLLVDLGFLRGTRGENRYGDDPLEDHRDYMTVG